MFIIYNFDYFMMTICNWNKEEMNDWFGEY